MTRTVAFDRILLLTKSDLVEDLKLESIIKEVRKEHSADVIPLSSTSGAGETDWEGTREGGNLVIGSFRSRQKHRVEPSGREGRVRNQHRAREERQGTTYDNQTTIDRPGQRCTFRRHTRNARVGHDGLWTGKR